MICPSLITSGAIISDLIAQERKKEEESKKKKKKIIRGFCILF